MTRFTLQSPQVFVTKYFKCKLNLYPISLIRFCIVPYNLELYDPFFFKFQNLVGKEESSNQFVIHFWSLMMQKLSGSKPKVLKFLKIQTQGKSHIV